MKKLALLILAGFAIGSNVNAEVNCSKKAPIIQNYVAKKITFAPFDVNKDRKANHGDIYDWKKLFEFVDVNRDGILTMDDATEIQKQISKKAKYELKYDANIDNRVNMEDVTYVQSVIADIKKDKKSYDINKDGLLSDIDIIILGKVIPTIVEYEKSLDTNKDGKVSLKDIK